MDSSTYAVGRFLVCAFFAVVFTQSAVDKVLDRDGNLDYFRAHFKGSVPDELVPMLLSALAALEGLAGVLCGLGILTGSFAHAGWGIAFVGVSTSGLALLALVLGQRLAKDYAGAAVVAAYFAVALLGVSLF